MGVNKKGGLVGGFDQLRAPDAPTISVATSNESVIVTITNPTDTGGGDITGYAVSALTGPIEDTTFAVTVVSSGGNKYAIDGSTQATLTLYKGHTYIFDQSDSSNSGHPLRLSTTSNGSHGGGSEYTTGVTTSGTPGSAGAFTKIAIATDAPDTLYYYCTNHSGMGGTANLKASLQGGASGSSSPITVSSLTNGESYNVRASAINAFGQSPYSAATTGSPVLPDRGLLVGLSNSYSYVNNIEYISIATTGNSTDFGDMTAAREAPGAAASKTRALFAGGRAGSVLDTIDYVSIASTGNASDFGDLLGARYLLRGLSSDTRAIIAGDSSNVIEYLTIASTGNGTDFGDRTHATPYIGAASSTTRGVFAGGYGGGTYNNVIDYITIASTGNASDFGDLTGTSSNSGREISGLSNNTRAVFGGGYFNGSVGNVMQYITIASTGNASDFGDLVANNQGMGGTSSATRGVFTGGTSNVIQYITIGSTGNTTDFGDISTTEGYLMSATSNAHGGLS